MLAQPSTTVWARQPVHDTLGLGKLLVVKDDHRVRLLACLTWFRPLAWAAKRQSVLHSGSNRGPAATDHVPRRAPGRRLHQLLTGDTMNIIETQRE